MAKPADITFTGRSGTEYTFSVYPMGTSFEKLGAVYFVTRRYKNSEGGYTHERIYVGQTENLSTRFDDHHKQSCFDRKNANSVCVYVENSERKRLEIEDDLIQNYDPPCNG